MSTASSAAPQPFRPGIVARSIAAFSGTPGQIIKLVILSLTNALAVWAAYVLIDRTRWVALALLVVVTFAVDVVYLAPRAWTLPAKFLVPGTVFLLAFQLVPIVYTIQVALSNYSTGHIATKSEALATGPMSVRVAQVPHTSAVPTSMRLLVIACLTRRSSR